MIVFPAWKILLSSQGVESNTLPPKSTSAGIFTVDNFDL